MRTSLVTHTLLTSFTYHKGEVPCEVYLLLEDFGKGLEELKMRNKKLVGKLWTIVAYNRRGHTSNSCLNVLISTFIALTVKLVHMCLTNTSLP